VEFWSYVEDGEWEMDAPGDAELLLPWIYGKRWRKWQGVFYESIRDYERYREPAEDQLEGNRKYHFAALVPTRRGTVLQRPDGDVVPMDGIHVYPVTRFAGYNLEVSPLPPGTIAAWVHGYAGAEMFPTPGPDAVAVLSLPYHMPLVVDAVPADDTGHWWRVIDGLGSGVDGFVNDLAGVRRWSFAPPPTDVVEGQVWLDVDVEQQMLTLYEGWRAIYVTMVSTGKVGHSTPLGTFRIFDKMATVDMINREDAPEDDRYHVEAVPWSMHFYPRYALHGAYWHWGFGNRASHGCVNLAPLDAHWLFDRLDPVLPDGWHSVYEDAEHLGSLLRIRYGGDVGRERRLAAGAVWKK
jgi:lipoprotein-anchoring transpeptidase ErfK/SrfK